MYRTRIIVLKLFVHESKQCFASHTNRKAFEFNRMCIVITNGTVGLRDPSQRVFLSDGDIGAHVRTWLSLFA